LAPVASKHFNFYAPRIGSTSGTRSIDVVVVPSLPFFSMPNSVSDSQFLLVILLIFPISRKPNWIGVSACSTGVFQFLYTFRITLLPLLHVSTMPS
jgi:hypothetical protein